MDGDKPKIGNRLGIIRGWDPNWFGRRPSSERLDNSSNQSSPAIEEKIRKPVEPYFMVAHVGFRQRPVPYVMHKPLSLNTSDKKEKGVTVNTPTQISADVIASARSRHRVGFTSIGVGFCEALVNINQQKTESYKEKFQKAKKEAVWPKTNRVFLPINLKCITYKKPFASELFEKGKNNFKLTTIKQSGQSKVFNRKIING